MFILDEILELLKDGQWQSLKELTTKAALNPLHAQTLISFLSRHNFVELDEAQQTARLNPLTREFVYDIQRLELEDMSALSSR